jgi:ABC-type Co2+ transport system permease subunit
MLLWLRASGMTTLEAALFVFASLVIYLGMARIVSEAGVLYTWGTLSPQSFVFSAVGTQAMTGSSVTSILLSYSLINYLRGLFGPALAHVARFGAAIGGSRRQLFWAVLGSGVVALGFAFWYTLQLSYDHGAYNTYGWPRFFNGNPKGVFSDTMGKLRNPFPTDWRRLSFTGVGAVLMAVLTVLRSRLTWWRLHPIGFAMSAMINTEHLALPLFIAWSIKSTMLKVGGVQLYRRGSAFFIGLIVGYVAGVCLCSVVDSIWFPGQGHSVHGW